MTICAPVIETAEHIEAARRATRELNAQYLTVIQEGKYTDAYLARTGADAPKFTPADLKAIGSPLDFVGINIYTPLYVAGRRRRRRATPWCRIRRRSRTWRRRGCSSAPRRSTGARGTRPTSGR